MIFFQFSISIFKLFVKSKVIHEGVLTKELLQEREFQFENTCFSSVTHSFLKKWFEIAINHEAIFFITELNQDFIITESFYMVQF